MPPITYRKTHLYFAGFLATAGVWWWWSNQEFSGGGTLCFFKTVTGLPCPSCGTTRAFGHLMHGDLTQALLTNPLGLLVGAMLAIGGVILITDFLTGKNKLEDLFQAINQRLNKPAVLLPVMTIILLNWIWNLNKGL